MRLDYACTSEHTLLLRFGIPGQAPRPCAAATDGALAEAEGFIDDFLARDFRSILLGRSTEPVGEDLLFAGETEFYEGFLGREGLPLTVTDRNSDGSCVLEGGLPHDVCLNVNFPAECTPQGVKVVRAARGHWNEEYRDYTSPHGRPFFWLTGTFHNDEPDNPDTDEYWLKRGYGTIVPIRPDQTASDRIVAVEDMMA